MSLKQDKYDIEVRYDVQSSGWIIYGWNFDFDRYNKKISMEEAECNGIWKTKQRKKRQKQKKEGTSKPFPKYSVLWIRQTKHVK